MDPLPGAEDAADLPLPAVAHRRIQCQTVPSWIAIQNAAEEKLSLSKNNWPKWSKNVCGALDLAGGQLSLYLTGGIACPGEDQRDDRANWCANDAMIRAYCRTLAEGEDRRIIEEATSAKDMWAALKERHTKPGAYGQVLYLRDLLEKRFTAVEPFDAQARAFYELCEYFIDIGPRTADSLAVVVTLHALNFIAEDVVTGLICEQSNDDTALTFDRVVKHLKVHQQQIEAKARAALASVSAPVALAATTQLKSSSGPCLNCKKPGHSLARCWAPGGGAEGQREQILAGAEKRRVKREKRSTPPSSSSTSSAWSTAHGGKKIVKDHTGHAFYIDGDHMYPLSPADTALSALSSTTLQ